MLSLSFKTIMAPLVKCVSQWPFCMSWASVFGSGSASLSQELNNMKVTKDKNISTRFITLLLLIGYEYPNYFR